jgi:hypothetical protein
MFIFWHFKIMIMISSCGKWLIWMLRNLSLKFIKLNLWLMWLVLLAQMWTHFLFFTFSKLKISKFTDVNTLEAQLIFLPKPNFCNLFEFLATNSIQKSISSTPYIWKLWNNSIKSNSSIAFQQHQEWPQILI